jgi:uncharacterized protein
MVSASIQDILLMSTPSHAQFLKQLCDGQPECAACYIVVMRFDKTDTELTSLLRTCRTIAVVGLSDNPLRPSYTTSQYMQAQGYRIVPVNPKGGVILGETCFRSLSEISFAVDMVNVFRRSEDMLPVAQELVQQAKRLGLKCFWQQLDIANEEAAELAEQTGIASVMDRCVKIEHARLMR